MSQKTYYICDFCRAEKDLEDLIGLKWSYNGSSQLDKLEKTQTSQANLHLCKWCKSAIGDIK